MRVPADPAYKVVQLAKAEVITLPAEILAADREPSQDAAALTRATEQLRQAEGDLRGARDRDFGAAARSGQAPVVSGDRGALEANAKDLARFIEWLRQRDTGRGSWDIIGMIGQRRDEIITEHLRPAQQAILDELRELAPVLQHLELTDAAMTRAPEAARAAWVRLPDLMGRYWRIRDAYTALLPRDHDATLAEIENAPALYGTSWAGRFQSGVGGKPWTPWPKDNLARMVWLATSPARPWMPTPAELADLERRVAKATREVVGSRRAPVVEPAATAP
jgi:hypothetical protein